MKPAIPDVVDDFARYFREVAGIAWGRFHVVLDDGNVEDDFVRSTITAMREAGDVEGERLACLLLEMSQTQRRKLPYAVHERLREKGGT